MNVYRQPRDAPTNAPNGTPGTWATVIRATTVARARPRYSAGASELAAADAASTNAAAASAARTRAISTVA